MTTRSYTAVFDIFISGSCFCVAFFFPPCHNLFVLLGLRCPIIYIGGGGLQHCTDSKMVLSFSSVFLSVVFIPMITINLHAIIIDYLPICDI